MRCRKLRSGITLIELLVAVGLIALGVVVAVQVMNSVLQRSQLISVVSEAESRRALFRTQVSSAVRNAFRGRLFLAPTIANYMGIGAQLRWNAFAATEGALLVSPSCSLAANALSCVPDTAAHQILTILGVNRDVGMFSLVQQETFSPTERSLNGVKTVTATGSPVGHAVGEVLGVNTALGVEFFELVAIAPAPVGATLQLRSLYDGGLPAFMLPAGSTMFRTLVTVVGHVAGTDTVRLLRYDPVTQIFGTADVELNRMAAEGTLRVERLMNLATPNDPTQWEVAGQRSFVVQATDFMLRATWRRPSLAASQARGPSADLERRFSLEVGL